MNDNPKKWLLILGVITLLCGIYHLFIPDYLMGTTALLIAASLISVNYKAYNK